MEILFTEISLIDPLIAKILVGSFDYILSSKRQYIKDLSPLQLQKLCELLLTTLRTQNSNAQEVYIILKQAGTQKLQNEIIADVQKQIQEKDLSEEECTSLIAFRQTNDEFYRESCIRLISQVCFENSPLVPDDTVQNIYNYVSQIAFMTEQTQKHSKNKGKDTYQFDSKFKKNNIFYKTLRASFNCIANLLAQEEQSKFVRQQNPTIFKLLKNEFEYMMSKIQLHHRSKRFISQMTTVLRALQFSMNLGTYSNSKLLQSQQKLPNNDNTIQSQTVPFIHPIKQGPGSGQNILYQQSQDIINQTQQSNEDISKNTNQLDSKTKIDICGEIKLPDNDAVSLFLNFYKLLFLGSKFASKMLKIEFESKESQKIILPIQSESVTEDDDEEAKLMMDTSDAIGDQSSDYFISKDSNFLTADELDPYQKIKVHSNLSIRNLLKNNSKILINYWYLIFPSFMIKQHSEFSNYLTSFEQLNNQQSKKSEDLLKNIFDFLENKEPTLFFVIRHHSTQSQLKTSLFMTIQQMLDNQMISKQLYELEKLDNQQIDDRKAIQKTYLQFTDFLGQFLRFTHYILIGFMNEGAKNANSYPSNPGYGNCQNDKQKHQQKQYYSNKDCESEQKKELQSNSSQQNNIKLYFDRQTFIQIIKTIKTLIQVTPYHLMRKGLASNIVQALIENIQQLEKIGNRDQLLRNEIFLAINQAMQKPEITQELKLNIFQIDKKSILSEQLLNTLFKVHNFISNEKIQILQTIGKNYAEVLTYQWLKIEKGYNIPKIQNFVCQTLQKIDRKKVNLILKILEDWLKNYQILNQVDNNDEKVLRSEINDINKIAGHLNNQQQKNQIISATASPYESQTFCEFIYDTINQYLFKQMEYQIPPILKAAIIKTFGYLIQHQKGSSYFSTDEYVCNEILGNCLSSQILNENNINVQIRNSWTISFVCSLYPIQKIIQTQFFIDSQQFSSIQKIEQDVIIPSQLQNKIQVNSESSHNEGINSQMSTSVGEFIPSLKNNQQPWNPQLQNQTAFSSPYNPTNKFQKQKLQETQQQIQNKQNFEILINACIKYTQYQASNKEKVAASSIRALGFLVQNLIQLDNEYKQSGNNKKEKQLKNEEQILSLGQIDYFIKIIIDVIVQKLYSQKQCTPKVIWNICVAISKIIDTFNIINQINIDKIHDQFNYENCYLSKIFCFETTQFFLKIFMEGQNYKTKIHACQTLLKYVNLNQYGYLDNKKNPENLLRLFWIHIQEQFKFQINQNRLISLNQTTQLSQSTPLTTHQTAAIEQSAYIEQIDRSFIDFWAHICNLTCKNLSNPSNFQENSISFTSDGSEHQSVMIRYFNENAYDLLQSIIQYLRRELKVPEYNQIFEQNEEFTQEDFDLETQQIFKSNPFLFEKLQKIQNNIIGKIFEIIDNKGSEVRVSFFVFESFQKLAKSNILNDYRGLEILRQARSFDSRH